MATILIIDDDEQLCTALALVIERMGYEVTSAHTLASGLKHLEANETDVVILDIRLPDGDGLEALPKIRDSLGAPEVIILSGAGDPDGAELAIRNGAWSYIAKPPTLSKIQLPVQRAVEHHERKKSLQPPMALKREGIVGESRSILTCLDMVAQASISEASVLVTGETGTGKELFARAIHANCGRRDKPFIVVDCAAIAENLVESMLFGHEKGAFTGADKRSPGLIKQADGGVLFLDEVGEMPISIQKSFLRVLQDGCFRPVGGSREEKSDFRLVAATNRDLEEMVSVWQFRQDLLFRIRTMTIDLPPLRERHGDVKRLAAHFADRHCKALRQDPKAISTDMFESLEQYHWPGNVRELGSALEHSVTAAGEEPVLQPRHLPMNIRVQLARQSLSAGGKNNGQVERRRLTRENFPQLKEFRAEALAELERQYLGDLMSISGGDIPAACDLSGLSRARLYALLKQYGISR